MVENHVRSALVPLYPRLRRFAVALTGSRAEGDDLVQHACERALARTYQWHPGTRLDSWLYRIIQNTWADERKSARNRTQAPIEAATNAIGDDGVRRAEARLTLDNVYRELCNLPEEQRAVLLLVCVDGLSYKEVAEILRAFPSVR
jgi:RNA polymerase sigma-70 factor, ECF subfamily